MNDLLVCAREGGMEAAYQLYAAALPLICSVARKFAHIDSAISMEDLLQEGFFAVLDAARSYDQDRGAWNQTLVWALKARFARMFPPRRRSMRALPYDQRVEQIAGPEGADEALLAEDFRMTVRAAVHGHTDELTAQILQAHDMDGVPLADVARRLGLSYQTVCVRRRMALRRLRRIPELRALFRDDGDIETLTYGRSAEDCALGVMRPFEDEGAPERSFEGAALDEREVRG